MRGTGSNGLPVGQLPGPVLGEGRLCRRDVKPGGVQRRRADAVLGPFSEDGQGVVDAQQPVATALDAIPRVVRDGGPIERSGLASPMFKVVHPVAHTAGIAPDIA